MVRQAICYALNVTRILELGYKGDGEISYSLVGNFITPYYEPVFEKYKCDPEKARQLLTEAGFPNGFSMDFYYTPTKWGSMDKDAAMLIRDDLEKVGIQCTVKMEEWAVFKEKQDSAIGMATKGWILDYPDPDDVMNMAIQWQSASLNWNGPEREQFDEIGVKAKGVADQSKRKEFYDEEQRILAEECPIYPIKCSNRYAFFNKWVKGFQLYPNCYADDVSFSNCYIAPH